MGNLKKNVKNSELGFFVETCGMSKAADMILKKFLWKRYWEE